MVVGESFDCVISVDWPTADAPEVSADDESAPTTGSPTTGTVVDETQAIPEPEDPLLLLFDPEVDATTETPTLFLKCAGIKIELSEG